MTPAELDETRNGWRGDPAVLPQDRNRDASAICARGPNGTRRRHARGMTEPRGSTLGADLSLTPGGRSLSPSDGQAGCPRTPGVPPRRVPHA
jgi:hypothetical protein